MIDGDVIAERARTLVGTQFRHQGRARSLGVDCLGVVVLAVGGEAHDQRDYQRLPSHERLRWMLDTYFDRIAVSRLDAAPIGSIVAFAFGRLRRVRHLGVRTADGFVHANEQRVVEQAVAAPWTSYFEGAYQWRA